MKYFLMAGLLLQIMAVGVQAAPPPKKEKISQSEIAKIEKQVQELIKKENVPEEKLFYLYMLGARNLRKYELYDLSFKYYLKAFDLKVEYNQNRLQGMLELAWLYVTVKKWQELSAFNKKLREYSSKYGFDKSIKSLPYTLDYFDVISTQKTVKEAIGKDYSHFFDTNYNNMIIDRELEINIRQGNFEAARAMFKYKVFDQYTYYQYVLAFDVLNVITKKEEKKLECQARSKMATGVEVELCQLLVGHQSGRKFNPEKLHELSARVKKKSGLEFLAPAVDALLKI